MKKILYLAATLLGLAMFLLDCYFVTQSWMVLIASVFLFGLSIGLFVAYHYSKYKERYENQKRDMNISYGD